MLPPALPNSFPSSPHLPNNPSQIQPIHTPVASSFLARDDKGRRGRPSVPLPINCGILPCPNCLLFRRKENERKSLGSCTHRAYTAHTAHHSPRPRRRCCSPRPTSSLQGLLRVRQSQQPICISPAVQVLDTRLQRPIVLATPRSSVRQSQPVEVGIPSHRQPRRTLPYREKPCLFWLALP